jgi:hypothetical protein
MLKPDNQKHLPDRNRDISNFYNFLKKHNLNDYYNRCCICDWSRANIDLCHVRAHKDKGYLEIENIVPLCPNHHRLFDRDELESYEYESIQHFLWTMVDKVVPWKTLLNKLPTSLSTEIGDN